MSDVRRVAIIQARMSSSRFPGKSLRLLAGQPVIWHVLHRLALCNSIDEVVLATSTDATDDPLAVYAEEQGVRVVRGPLDNVLQRYVMAAEESEADVIVRVTGDAPLVDPGTIDRMVDALVEQDGDYCAIDPEHRTIHDGFEPFTASALLRVVELAGDDPANVEHVTPMMKRRPDLFRIVCLPSDPDVRIEDVRTSVDTPADLEFLAELYRRSGADAGDIDVRQVVSLVREHPELPDINAHVHQKTAFERTRMVLFRCDGGSVTGMGHVRRCLSLAAEFAERHGWGVRFALEGDEIAAEQVRRRGYGVEFVGPDLEVVEMAYRLRPDAVIMDTRSAISREDVVALREQGSVCAVVDDASDRRFEVDMAFYPPVPQALSLTWDGAHGDAHIGWEWVVLGREFASCPPRVEPATANVLVTMGGADPAGTTKQVASALAGMSGDFGITVVVGPAAGDAEIVDGSASQLRTRVLRDVADMCGVMSDATVAVASFGVTAYELACAGVPAVLLSATDDHALSASAFHEAGVAISIGLVDHASDAAVAQAVRSLLDDPVKRALMSENAQRLVDARGAGRIADLVVTCACAE